METMVKMPKILIVEDEQRIRQIYRKLLTLEHYQVVEAEDSKTACRILLQDKDIQLILLDINLPVVDGGILYRMIRMMDPSVKVLVTSAYPIQDQKDKICRADDYYDKSQGTELLIKKVKSLI